MKGPNRALLSLCLLAPPSAAFLPPPLSPLVRSVALSAAVGRDPAAEVSSTLPGDGLRALFGHLPSAPRWRPAPLSDPGSVADAHPAFRTSPPPMSADARAGAMRRNSRKRRTGMVRQALRLYHGGDPEERDVRHHEAALAAAARLGRWREGAAVLGEVERAAADGRAEAARKEKKERGEHRVEMTEGMILSFVRACIRGGEGDPLARREPLDVAAEVIANLETLYGLSLNAAMVNPLAAAYQKLGLYSEAASLLSLLSDRTGPRLDEAGIKDGASYALVVGGHVAQRDWIAALERLREMREAGACVRRRDLDRWGVMIESQGRSKRIQNLLVIEEKEGVEAI